MLAYRRMDAKFTNGAETTNLTCWTNQMIYFDVDLDPEEMGWSTAISFLVAFAAHNFGIFSIAPLKPLASEGLALLLVEASR